MAPEEVAVREADALIRELDQRARNERMIRVIEPDTQRPPPRPRGRQKPINPVDLDCEPLQELTYHILTLIAEMRNLRDSFTALNNAVFNNTNYLEQLVQQNEEARDDLDD